MTVIRSRELPESFNERIREQLRTESDQNFRPSLCARPFSQIASVYLLVKIASRRGVNIPEHDSHLNGQPDIEEGVGKYLS